MTTATTTKPTTTTTTPVVDTPPCDVTKLKVGDLWTRHSAGEVTKIEKNQEVPDGQGGTTRITIVTLKNAEGFEWQISENIIEKEFSFADQFDETEKLSRTAAIEILVEAPRTAMTVCFNKKPDHKKIAGLLEAGKGETTTRKWNKTVKDAIAGEESVVVGYHTRSFDEHRRLRFIKLGDTDKSGNFRLVDPRTLQYFIVGRKKYVVK